MQKRNPDFCLHCVKTIIPFLSVPGELSAALVLSKCASARLDSVDASEALSLPGVVAFVDHRCWTTPEVILERS